METPFIFGSTVSQAAFTNREEELVRLKANLSAGINTIIISPRRWGKSSLVERALRDLKEQPGQKTVLIDLFGSSSQQEFLEAFARETIKASSTQWQDWVTKTTQFIKQVVPQISFGVDPTSEFNLKFDWNELEKSPDEILNLPEELAKAGNFKFIICLDEFQNIAQFDGFEAFEKKLRSIWQRHTHVAYCLFGSKRNMLAEIFNKPSKPFYRFGDIMFLPKIATPKWLDFLEERFRSTNKEIPASLAEKLVADMKNHSWYVQQLAHYLWNKTVKKATQEGYDAAMQELLATNMPLYQRDIQQISKTQLNLLKAISAGEGQLTSQRVMERYKLGTPRNVQKSKAMLESLEIVHNMNDTLEFLDPVFEIWFKKQFRF
jgi:AAA+ ATPase superfamily predicted ATPase